MNHLCYLCFVFDILSRLFIAALWSPAGKGLTSWLLFVMFNCDFVTLPCGILGQVWYLIISISDYCRLSYFVNEERAETPGSLALLVPYWSVICVYDCGIFWPYSLVFFLYSILYPILSQNALKRDCNGKCIK